MHLPNCAALAACLLLAACGLSESGAERALRTVAGGGLVIDGNAVPAAAVAVDHVDILRMQPVDQGDGIDRVYVEARARVHTTLSGGDAARVVDADMRRAAAGADIRDLSDTVMGGAMAQMSTRRALDGVPVGAVFDVPLAVLLADIDGDWRAVEVEPGAATRILSADESAALAADHARQAAEEDARRVEHERAMALPEVVSFVGGFSPDGRTCVESREPQVIGHGPCVVYVRGRPTTFRIVWYRDGDLIHGAGFALDGDVRSTNETHVSVLSPRTGQGLPRFQDAWKAARYTARVLVYDKPVASLDLTTLDDTASADYAAVQARRQEHEAQLQRQTDRVTAAARERTRSAVANAANDERAAAIHAAEQRELERARREADDLMRLQRERAAAIEAADG